jgi:kumamolisin
MMKFSTDPIQQLTHEEFEKTYGCDAKDIEIVKKFAREHDLNVARVSVARRCVMLAGTVTNFNRAFGINLKSYAYANGTYRGRTGPVKIPAHLTSIVEGVFGLDNRPAAERFRAQVQTASGENASSGAKLAELYKHAFSGAQLAKLYNFPQGFDGSGQTIGIIALGGGYRPSELDAYFSSLGLPTPTVNSVFVDGATNSPGNKDPDGEIAMDLQVAGAVAPGAKLVVYFAPDTPKGFLDAVTKAVHDTENNPSIISITCVVPEDKPSSSYRKQFDKALHAAVVLGITVCIAAGDNGAAGVEPSGWDGKAHVDFPASSPFALACGGTRLTEQNGVISSESVWKGKKPVLAPNGKAGGSFGSGGGGVSGIFGLPGYQQAADVPPSPNRSGFKGRGVPDVAAYADSTPGYKVLVDGEHRPQGGTSAAAPLWAGLIALINQKLNGRVGFVNPQLYAIEPGAGAFNDITDGDNRVSFKTFNNVGYDAKPGWDAASGLGSPNGTVLSNVLRPGAVLRRRPRNI